jgi:toxin YoeB
MIYKLLFSRNALDDISFHRKSGDKAVLAKIDQLLNELLLHPSTGTGQPEKLKHELSGKFSRRINRKHRLIYEIDELSRTVTVLSAKAHYSD